MDVDPETVQPKDVDVMSGVDAMLTSAVEVVSAAFDNELSKDLTNSHLKSLKDVTIPQTLTALDLTANRLTEFDPRVLALTGLRTLNLRQNLLADVSAWQGAQCKGTLEDVEFRDNQLTEIPPLAGFSSLRRLEYSYNEIRSMSPIASLAPCPLQELYLASNKISAIAGVADLTQLRILELGSNRIKNIEHLDTLTALQELWLGRNRIASVTNLHPLINLRRISVQSNRLEVMTGFESCLALEELYLSHNGIRKLEGLAPLVRLKILDVSSNRLTCLEGLDTLTQLEDLWLNDNGLTSLEDLAPALAPLAASLTTVYLENNPAVQSVAAAEYRSRMQVLLPHLKQLDSHYL